MEAKKILSVLETLRAPIEQDEYDLHHLIAKTLQENEISFIHEAKLKSRCRIDFLCENVGIEVKRGRPVLSTLKKQIEKYLESPLLSEIIVAVERSTNLPLQLLGKNVYVLSLNRLWGLSDEKSTLSNEKQNEQSNKEIQEKPAVQKTENLSLNLEPLSVPSPLSGDTAIEEKILSDLSNEDLPVYLRNETVSGHRYGTLSYNARRKQWVIKGEPCVTEMAKRLFPGSDGMKRGEARFTAHRRIIGDLNWLMQRYPLTILPKDQQRYQNALTQAQQYFRQREKARLMPPVCQPDESVFCGTLRPFQQSGVSFLDLTPRALLADEMGLGKTVQALCSLSMRKLFPAVIVVPPHLVLNWQQEISRFVRIEGRQPVVHIVKGLTPYKLPAADIYIVHYLLLRGWKEVLPGCSFRAVVFDEIQELRRAGTDKYSAASLLAESCDIVMGLSGTPIYNEGGEIWNIVNILDFHFLGDWESFSREWCAGYGNRIVLKPDLLGEHLRREGLMLRRTKQEVLPELPEKRRLVQEIDADDRIYQQLMKPVVEKLNRYQTDDTLTASARALLEDQISQEERQATGIAKAPYVCQFVRALVESGEKVLLFAHHHKVMDIYQKELKTLHPVFITGRENDTQKQNAVDRFMNDKTNLCCISLRSASGLNLQKATCVVFGELDWSPAVHSQAEDRAHRIGQKDSLLCYYLVSPRGSDADMQEALGLKVSQFLGLMGDHAATQQEIRKSASLARTHVEHLLSRLSHTENMLSEV